MFHAVSTYRNRPPGKAIDHEARSNTDPTISTIWGSLIAPAIVTYAIEVVSRQLPARPSA